MKRDNVLTIFTKLRHRLHSTARSIAGQDYADDILQDAFCKLWTLKNLPSDQLQTEKIAFTITKNLSIDFRRHEIRNEQSSVLNTESDDSLSQDTRELFYAVKSIIEDNLSETQRQVLWMRDYEGYTFTEIAERMHLSEDNVRQILSRARKVVRETYKRLN